MKSVSTSVLLSAMATVVLGSIDIDFSAKCSSMSSGSFCHKGSLGGHILIRCDGGKPQECDCKTQIPSSGGDKSKALCYEKSSDSGNAQCSLDGVVYPFGGTPAFKISASAGASLDGSLGGLLGGLSGGLSGSASAGISGEASGGGSGSLSAEASAGLSGGSSKSINNNNNYQQESQYEEDDNYASAGKSYSYGSYGGSSVEVINPSLAAASGSGFAYAHTTTATTLVVVTACPSSVTDCPTRSTLVVVATKTSTYCPETASASTLSSTYSSTHTSTHTPVIPPVPTSYSYDTSPLYPAANSTSFTGFTIGTAAPIGTPTKPASADYTNSASISRAAEGVVAAFAALVVAIPLLV